MNNNLSLSAEDKGLIKALLSHLSTIQKLSQGTIVTRLSRIRIFLTWLDGQDPIPELTQEFFFYLKTEKKLTNTSLNTYLTSLKSLERFLERKILGELSLFPEEETNISPLTPVEARLLRKWVFGHYSTYNALVGLLIDTGCRWQDVQRLQKKNIDITGQEISFIQKNRQRKLLHIEQPLLSILDTMIKKKQDEDLVFQNTKGGIVHYPDFHKYLKRLAKELGITKRVSPHVLRHSYAQNFYNKTRDILLTQDLIGHKRIETTMRYVRNSHERVKEAQQIHPHLEDTITPELLIEQVQKELESRKLETHKKFNALKIKKAINRFIEDLYGSIEFSV